MLASDATRNHSIFTMFRRASRHSLRCHQWVHLFAHIHRIHPFNFCWREHNELKVINFILFVLISGFASFYGVPFFFSCYFTLVCMTTNVDCLSSWTKWWKSTVTENASRRCHLNGDWENRTNYDLCQHVANPTSVSGFEAGVELPTIVYFTGYTISLISLTLAVAVFVYFKWVLNWSICQHFPTSFGSFSLLLYFRMPSIIKVIIIIFIIIKYHHCHHH